jgi:hypothetical protein
MTIIAVHVTGLNTKDLYADITNVGGPNKNELVQIDPKTGVVTPIVTGLDNPHGLAFVSDPPVVELVGVTNIHHHAA